MMNERLKQLIMSKLDELGFRTDNDAMVKVKKVAINFADSVAGAEVVTDFVFPDKCEVITTTLDVVTKEDDAASDLIIIGNETVRNGFANAMVTGTAGLIKPSLANGALTVGALLSADEDGAGALVPQNDVTSGGEALCWTPAGDDFAELAGFIWVMYIDLT